MTDRAQEAARAMREAAARACQEVDDAERSATIGRPTSGEYGIAARRCAAAIRALPLPAPEATAGETALTQADAIVSRLHDVFYSNNFDLTAEPTREIANGLIWKLHEILRAALAAPGEGEKGEQR